MKGVTRVEVLEVTVGVEIMEGSCLGGTESCIYGQRGHGGHRRTLCEKSRGPRQTRVFTYHTKSLITLSKLPHQAISSKTKTNKNKLNNE